MRSVANGEWREPISFLLCWCCFLSPLSGSAHRSLGNRSGHFRSHFCLEVAVKYTQGADCCLVLWDGRQKRGYKSIAFTNAQLTRCRKMCTSLSCLSPPHPAHLVPSTSPFHTGSMRQEFHPVLAPPCFQVFGNSPTHPESWKQLGFGLIKSTQLAGIIRTFQIPVASAPPARPPPTSLRLTLFLS